MRVVAGTAGGIQLLVPKTNVRPTMDRVKAAIFSSLGEAVVGAQVLDLFAGSGALGIEALSRGAASAVFVEQDREAIAAIEKNLVKTKLKGNVLRTDVFAFLRLSASGEMFQIIFADPPYEITPSGECHTALLLASEPLAQLLDPGGILIVEKRPGEMLPEMKLWRVIRQKTYGATEVLFLRLHQF